MPARGIVPVLTDPAADFVSRLKTLEGQVAGLLGGSVTPYVLTAQVNSVTMASGGVTYVWSAGNVVADPAAMYNSSTGVITIPKAGVYAVTGSVFWSVGTPAGNRELSVYKNGVQQWISSWPGSSVLAHPLAFNVYCAQGDTLTIYMNQQSGAPMGFITILPFSVVKVA